METSTILILMTAASVLIFFVVVAAALMRIDPVLESIGGRGEYYLAKLRLGLRAIERETSHLPAAAPRINEGLSALAQELKARDDGPDANAIPWLLLSAKSTSGNGVFGKTQSIQRLRTAGGKAPAQGCGQDQAGKESRVPYTATYYFYASRP